MKREYLEERIFYYRYGNQENLERLKNDYKVITGYNHWGWDQESIAKLIGVSRVTVNALLNGKTKLSLDMLLKVKYLTGLTLDEIVAEEIKLGLVEIIKISGPGD